MARSKLDLPQGTLGLMVLQALAAMGPLPGDGIARRIAWVWTACYNSRSGGTSNV